VKFLQLVKKFLHRCYSIRKLIKKVFILLILPFVHVDDVIGDEVIQTTKNKIMRGWSC